VQVILDVAAPPGRPEVGRESRHRNPAAAAGPHRHVLDGHRLVRGQPFRGRAVGQQAGQLPAAAVVEHEPAAGGQVEHRGREAVAVGPARQQADHGGRFIPEGVRWRPGRVQRGPAATAAYPSSSSQRASAAAAAYQSISGPSPQVGVVCPYHAPTMWAVDRAR